MKGRLPKIRRNADAPSAPDDATAGPGPAASPDDQPTEAYGAPLVPPPSGTGAESWAPPTVVAGAVPPPVQQPPAPPADLDPASLQVASTPSFRDRGRLRRRLSYLRRVRELGFRDLGGLVFDLHRFGRDGQALVQAKLDALSVVDRELRALERVLKDKPLYVDLREPGIAACPRCAALHGSDARFCPSCGAKLSGPLGIGEIGEGAHPVSPPPAQVAAPPAAPPVPADQAPTTVMPPVPAPPAPAEPVAAPAPVAPEPEPVAPEPVVPEPEPVAEEPEAAAAPEPPAEEPAPEPPAGEPAPDAPAEEDGADTPAEPGGSDQPAS